MWGGGLFQESRLLAGSPLSLSFFLFFPFLLFFSKQELRWRSVGLSAGGAAQRLVAASVLLGVQQRRLRMDSL